MAKMPMVAKLIYNPSSAAPGFKIKMFFHYLAFHQF